MFSEEDSSLSMFNCEDVISNALERNTCSNSWREIHKVFSSPVLSVSERILLLLLDIFVDKGRSTSRRNAKTRKRKRKKKGTRGLIIFLRLPPETYTTYLTILDFYQEFAF